MALGLFQSPTEILPGGILLENKARPAHKTDLNAIFEPIV
jgi:hypothetical protein